MFDSYGWCGFEDKKEALIALIPFVWILKVKDLISNFKHNWDNLN
jgi:hypothetical protein